MHPLHNGSQVTARPARKTTSGTMGYFSESNDNNAPSYPGADFFNDQIDEFKEALAAAGVTYDPTKTDHLAKILTANSKAGFIKYNLFRGMPMSSVGPTPDQDVFLPAGRVELLRSEYQTVFQIVSASAFFTDQATIDADPRAYAGHWGTGDGATTFTTDDWALMMNIKVAGGYGAAGSTKEDHLQNILASTTGNLGIGSADGAFVASNSGPNNTNGGTAYRTLTFDASLVARTDTYTDTMGLFLDYYRVIPKGVFSYA